MKTSYILILTILFQYCTGQSGTVPKCFENQKNSSKMKFIKLLKLPNNETVYKFSSEKPPKCMDCISGVVYKDSLCNTVASFTIGFAIRRFVKEGYQESWFEAFNTQTVKTPKSDLTEEEQEEKEKYFAKFKTPQKFKITEILSAENLLKLKKNDILKISNQNGIEIHRKGKKLQQYKLLPETAEFSFVRPCRVPPCPEGKMMKSFFRWDRFGIYFELDHSHNSMSIFDFDENTRLSNFGWKTLYEFQKLK